MTTPTTRLAEIAEREAFEAWVPNPGVFSNCLQKDSEGNYYHMPTDLAWKAWQARASRPVVVTDPCTTCHCQERALKMLGDQRVSVSGAAEQFGRCKTCGTQLVLHFWPRPGGPPGNGWGPCEVCASAALNGGTDETV